MGKKLYVLLNLTSMILFIYVWWTYEHTASSSKVKMVLMILSNLRTKLVFCVNV